MILALSAAPVRAQNAQLAGCNQYGAQDFEIGVRNDLASDQLLSVRVIRVSDGLLVDERDVVTSGPPLDVTGCGWIARIDEGPFLPENNIVDLEGGTLYRIEIWGQNQDRLGARLADADFLVGAYEYLLYTYEHPAPATSFYRNGPSDGTPDLFLSTTRAGCVPTLQDWAEARTAAT